MQKKNEIVICGGGMVGMVFALHMSNYKIKVCLVDQKKKNIFNKQKDERTTAISQGSSRILETIKIWKKIRPEAQPIYEILVSEGHKKKNMKFDHKKINEGPLGFIVDNKFFKKKLFEEVKKSKFITYIDDTEIKQINQNDDYGVLQTNNGPISYKLLVAADGRFSATRFQANIKYFFHDYRQNAFVFNISHEKSHNGVALERFFPTGPMALLPMKNQGSKKSSVVWTVNSKISNEEKFKKNFLNEFKKVYQNFFGEINSLSKVQKYPLNIYQCYDYSKNNIFLIGDACQAIHPIAGQGFNLGLRDAKCLAELIKDFKEIGLDICQKRLGKDYRARRIIDKTLLIKSTHNLNKLFASPLNSITMLRRLGLSIFSKSNFLKNQSMKFAMGLMNLDI